MAGRDHYSNVPERRYKVDSSLVSVGDGYHRDAFARQRYSTPYTLFDSVLNHSNQSHSWSGLVNGSGKIEWQSNRSSNFLTVGTDSGAYAVNQTKQHFHYQPGKSFTVMMTGVFAPGKENLVQQLGYFNTNSGLFFKKDNKDLSVVLRTSITGSPVDTAYQQSQWNIDPLNGTGPSGKILDPEKVQIFFLDFQWLGSGRIRFGFYIGEPVYCHEILNANIISNVFMSEPDLPCKYEIKNTGSTASPSTLEQICTTVISEGGYNPQGVLRGVDTTATPTTVPDTELVPLLSIRLKGDNLNSYLTPLNYSVIAASNDDVLIRLIINGDLDGASWASVNGESASEYDTTSSGITGGRIVWSDFVNRSLKTDFNISPYDEGAFVLAATASGVADTLTIAAQSRSTSASVSAALNFKEVF